MESLFPRYTHIVNRRLKNTYLTFDDDGELVIKSPEVSQRYIEQLLIRKAAWIADAQKRVKAKKGKLPGYEPDAHCYYLGDHLPIRFIPASKKRVKTGKGMGHLELYAPTFSNDSVRAQLEGFYRAEAECFITEAVRFWSEKMGVTYGSVKFRKAKRQWGSCSAKNDLSFNPMLMRLPAETIWYVVVHELSHTRHKHHQKAFWAFVEEHMPNYREHEAVLKTYSPS